jgi:hypothetical protein
MVKILKSVLALLAVLAFVSVANAGGIWMEVGDAGDLPSTAQIIEMSGGGGLVAITGSIATTTDADMYCFSITSPATFSATTVGTPGTLGDTQLRLFRGDLTPPSGIGIASNDDSVGLRSTLPAGSPLYATLPAGNYCVAISGFDRDPVSPGGEIFPDTFAGVFGPTGPGGGMAITGWAGTSATGTYTIALTGAAFKDVAGAVPEPGSFALLGLGVIGLAAYTWRRRK